MQNQKINPNADAELFKEKQSSSDVSSSPRIKPSLQNYVAPTKLSEYPKATCYQAGHLVTKNSGWRNKKPMIDLNKCVGCLQCYMYCPDGVIFKKDGKVAIDYDFCKGCGICAKTCRIHAIEMEAEENE